MRKERKARTNRDFTLESFMIDRLYRQERKKFRLSRPTLSNQTPVLNRFRQMLRFNFIRTCQMVRETLSFFAESPQGLCENHVNKSTCIWKTTQPTPFYPNSGTVWSLRNARFIVNWICKGENHLIWYPDAELGRNGIFSSVSIRMEDLSPGRTEKLAECVSWFGTGEFNP